MPNWNTFLKIFIKGSIMKSELHIHSSLKLTVLGQVPVAYNCDPS
jgi:hypothetical protein